MNTALQKYIQESELRIVNDKFRMRMAPDLAQKYDDGVYDAGVAEHAGCINELMEIGWQDVIGQNPMFYTYLVPDDRLIELLDYPYQRSRGGRPVQCFDKDGFRFAYGATQNTFIMDKKPEIIAHINNIHEYAHLVQGQLNPYKHVMFQEGFAEVVVWYLLGYESKYLEHAMAVADTDIYSANELLTTVSFKDKVPGKRCHFQKSYISSYVLVRTMVEQIESKYGVDRIGAIRMWLETYSENDKDKQGLMTDFAKMLGIDAGKLIYTTDYQKDVLQKIKTMGKMTLPPREIIR